MLLLSFALVLLATLLGAILAALHLRTSAAPPAWPAGAAHGLLGLAGFGVLLLALRGPTHGEALGVASFGRIAATLLGLALLAGLGILLARRRYPRLPGIAIGVHATIAVSGVVILAAYALMG